MELDYFKVNMRKFVVLFAAVALCSCSRLSLPDNWKEINAESLENASFREKVGTIDPEQTWNVASDFSLTDSLIITPAYDRIDTNLIRQSVTKSGDFHLTDRSNPLISNGTDAAVIGTVYPRGITVDGYWATSAFTVWLERLGGNATYTLGVYYTDVHGVKHEQNLYTGFNKLNFYLTKVIEVQLPWNISLYKDHSVFGFYLEATSGKTTKKFYTSRAMNGDNKDAHQMFSQDIDGYRIYFEDGLDSNLKYNDVSIYVEDALLFAQPIKPLDYDNGPWMVICEDYGTECDNDFNDVVFVVNRPEATKIQLELLAAGAVRNNVIYLGDRNLGEVHQLFGVPEGVMVNTYNGSTQIGQTTEVPVYSTELTVAKEFTMSSSDMGGFRIVSNGVEGGAYTSAKGTAPYMIVLPVADYQWPIEQVPIFDAYPKFINWSRNREVDKDWYLYPNKELLYKKTVTEE